jgi:hypothetical protein
MMLKIKYPVLLVMLALIFGSCEKEYSLEGNTLGNTAVFVFNGAPDACASAVITGNYQPGTALGPTNLVTIAVDVTTTGSYNLSTEVVNGVSFSGSGSFITTGLQSITLTGTGTPLAPGTYSYSPGANGCEFAVIFSGTSTTAEFTYDGGAGNSCTDALPAGIYTAGTALDATNTVALKVNVTTPGTWAITTPVVNGFSFSGAGSFTVLGSQTVTLNAIGTPLAGGSFEFTPSNNGCAFPVTVQPGVAAGEFYYEATIDGVVYKEIATGTNGYEAGSSIGGFEDVIFSSNISPATQPIPANQTEFTISKGVLHNYSTATNETFKSFFAPGTYPLVTSGSDGITLSWTDGSGTLWTTDNPPGTQTGSLFTIISTEELPVVTDYYIKVTATFNCTLYDLNGNSITVSDGTYVGVFGKL